MQLVIIEAAADHHAFDVMVLNESGERVQPTQGAGLGTRGGVHKPQEAMSGVLGKSRPLGERGAFGVAADQQRA